MASFDYCKKLLGLSDGFLAEFAQRQKEIIASGKKKATGLVGFDAETVKTFTEELRGERDAILKQVGYEKPVTVEPEAAPKARKTIPIKDTGLQFDKKGYELADKFNKANPEFNLEYKGTTGELSQFHPKGLPENMRSDIVTKNFGYVDLINKTKDLKERFAKEVPKEVTPEKKAAVGVEKLEEIKTILAKDNLKITDETALKESLKKDQDKWRDEIRKIDDYPHPRQIDIPILADTLKKMNLKPWGDTKKEFPIITKFLEESFLGEKKPKDLTIKEMVEGEGEVGAYKIGKHDAKISILKKIKSKRVEVADIKKSILDYSKQNLTELDRNKIHRLTTKATTQLGLNRALKEIDRVEERYQRKTAVADLKETRASIDFKQLRPEYKSTIESIFTDVDLVNRADKTTRGLESLADHLERNPDANIPPQYIRKLGRLEKKEIKDLATEDITLINNSVKSLVHQEKQKNKFLAVGKVRDFNKGKAQAIENVKSDKGRVFKKYKNKEPGLLRTTGIDFLNMEYMAKHLDKADRDINKAITYDVLNEGVRDTIKMRRDAKSELRGKTKDVDMDNWSESFHVQRKEGKNRKKVDYKKIKLSSGKTIELNSAERIQMYLLGQREQALGHLLADTGGIRIEQDYKKPRYKLTGEDIDAITKLTPGEKRVADALHDYYNITQKNKINETSVKINNREDATEKNYVRIRIFGEDIQRDYLTKGMLPGDMNNFTKFSVEGMGWLKPTTPGAKQPILLEDAFNAHMRSMIEASAYHGLAAPLRDAKALIKDPDYRKTIRNNYGEHYLKYMDRYLVEMEGEYRNVDNVEKITQEAINRLDSAFLGANPWIMVKQTISYFGASQEIKWKYLLRASKTKGVSDEVIKKYSPEGGERLEGKITRELGEVANVGKVRQFWTDKTTLPQKTMAGIRKFDSATIKRIWKAVEYETNELHPKLKGDERMNHIARRAEEVIRLTQPTFETKDRSAIGRSPATFTRLITKYSSQRNKNVMMEHRAINKYLQSERTSHDKKALASAVVTLGVLKALTLYSVDELRNLTYGRKEPDNKNRHRALKWMEYTLGDIYVVGNIFSNIVSGIEYGSFAKGQSDIISSTAGDFTDAMVAAWNAAGEWVDQSTFESGKNEDEKKWINSIIKAADNSAAVYLHVRRGIPYRTIKKMVGIPFVDRSKEKKSTGKTTTRPVRKEN
ncbi:MAG: hypothetical protein GY853_13440 [PVC group bacterium]|nr:hypothetical protein [PVC group bacterium]